MASLIRGVSHFPPGALLYFLETAIVSHPIPHGIVVKPQQPSTDAITSINLSIEPAKSLISVAEYFIHSRDPVCDNVLASSVSSHKLLQNFPGCFRLTHTYIGQSKSRNRAGVTLPGRRRHSLLGERFLKHAFCSNAKPR